MARCRQLKSVRYRRISKKSRYRFGFSAYSLFTPSESIAHSVTQRSVRPSSSLSACPAADLTGGMPPSSLEPQKVPGEAIWRFENARKPQEPHPRSRAFGLRASAHWASPLHRNRRLGRHNTTDWMRPRVCLYEVCGG